MREDQLLFGLMPLFTILKKKACVERIILNTPNQARRAGNKNGVARSITHGNEVVLHTLVPATPSKPTTCEPLLISTQVLPLATIKQNVSGSNSLIKPWNLRWFHFTNYSKVFRGGFTSSCGVKTGTGFCLYVFVRTFSKRSKGQTKAGLSKFKMLPPEFAFLIFWGIFLFNLCWNFAKGTTAKVQGTTAISCGRQALFWGLKGTSYFTVYQNCGY